MQASNAEKTRLGIFVISTVGLLLLILFFLAGQRIFSSRDNYVARFEESVGGLEPGASVKQNGVIVGSVTDIRTDTESVTLTVVEFAVEPGTPMKKDMYATLESFGITGMKYLEITGGSYTSESIPPGGEMRTRKSTFGKLTDKAEDIAQKIDLLLANVVEITDPESRERITQIMGNLEQLTGSLNQLVADITQAQPGQKLNTMMSEFEGAAKELRKEVARMDMDETLQEFRKSAETITGVAQKLDLTMLRVQDDLTTSMASFRVMMKNMEDFSRQIRNNPAVLLRGEDKRERKR